MPHLSKKRKLCYACPTSPGAGRYGTLRNEIDRWNDCGSAPRRVGSKRTKLSGLFKASAAALALTLLAPGSAFATVSVTPDDTDTVAGGGVYALAQAGERTYIGGLFTGVGGEPRSNVAAITADGTVDGQFNPGTNGKVMAVAASADGSTIFLGGLFTEAGGVPRANLAAVDAVTGVALAEWQADTTGTYPEVASLAVLGDRLYVGGRFTGIDGTTRDWLRSTRRRATW